MSQTETAKVHRETSEKLTGSTKAWVPQQAEGPRDRADTVEGVPQVHQVLEKDAKNDMVK